MAPIYMKKKKKEIIIYKSSFSYYDAQIVTILSLTDELSL